MEDLFTREPGVASAVDHAGEPVDSPLGRTNADPLTVHDVVGGVRAVAATTEPRTEPRTTDALVDALEQVRRLESWLDARKRALAVEVAHSTERDHEAWVIANPTWDEAVPDGKRAGVGRLGPTRAERLAVAERSAVAEIACALRVGEGAAHLLVLEGELLRTRLTDTAAALEAGVVTGAAARIIIDRVREYTDLPAADPLVERRVGTAVAQTERFLLQTASAGGTCGDVRARAQKLRERFHPLSRAYRQELARADRCVRVRPGQDGMAHLSAWLPAADAHEVDDRLTSLARAALGPQFGDATGRSPEGGVAVDGDGRTVGQARADVLVDLVTRRAGDGVHGGTDGAGGRADRGARGDCPGDDGRRHGSTADSEPGESSTTLDVTEVESRAPSLLLTMPASVLLGGDGPAAFGPFGVIPVEDARRLAAAVASYTLAVSLPDESSPTGTRLVTTGLSYRLPAALRRRLQLRDGTCRFPGCRRSAARCDLDHRVAWADGGTSDDGNLAHLCRRHHVLKHHSAWRPPDRPEEDVRISAGSPGHPGAGTGTGPPGSATLHWTSPTGRHYASDPDDPPF